MPIPIDYTSRQYKSLTETFCIYIQRVPMAKSNKPEERGSSIKRVIRLPLSLRERFWRLRPRRVQDLASIKRQASRLAHLPRPDFVIIGAPKCGTSWLQRVLAQHRDIVMVPDEIEYFSNHLDFPLGWYLAHFKRALAISHQVSPRVLGEKSARYCAIERDRIRMLHSLVPEANIILMTRDPVERHWSHAKRFFSKRRINPREGGITAVPREELRAFLDSTRPLGEFSAIIKRWTSVFPSRQFLIVSQEATLAYPRHTYDAVLKHIGVSRDYDAGKIKLLTAETNLGPKVSMPEDIAAYLEGMFAEERRRLKALFGDRVAVHRVDI